MFVNLYIPLLLLFVLSAAKKSIKTNSSKENLIALAAKDNGLIKLDDDTFNIITSPDRNWSVIVQLTAMKSAYKCEPCKQLAPVFTAMGKAWTKVNPTDRNEHFFASIDFDDGKESFRRLNLNQAPVVLIYPAATGPRSPSSGKVEPIVYDLQSSGFDAALIVEQLSRHTPVAIPYRPPPNYALIITTIVSIISLVAIVRFTSPFLMSRWTWAFITISTILIMTGGYMFVRIRGMPYVSGGSNGAVLIARGFQNQLGIEVQIIAFIYGLLSLSFISLALLVPRNTSPFKQRYAVYVWLGASITLFSVLLSIFRMKNGAYPFKLFM